MLVLYIRGFQTFPFRDPTRQLSRPTKIFKIKKNKKKIKTIEMTVSLFLIKSLILRELRKIIILFYSTTEIPQLIFTFNFFIYRR